MSTEIFQADPSEAVPALLLDSRSCRGSTLLKKKHSGTAREVQKTPFQAAAVVRGFHAKV